MFLAILVGVAIAIKYLPQSFQIPAFVVATTVLLSPSLAPATIVTVPVPLGLLLLVGAFTNSINETFELVAFFPVWHAATIPSTALLAYFVGKKMYTVRQENEPHT